MNTADLNAAGRRLGRAVVGDRTGLAILLSALAFYGLYWRVDVFIVDTFAVANVVAALAEGRLHVTPVALGPAGEGLPGMYRAGGGVYGRNYGQAALAVPALLALDAAAAVADLRVLLAAGWSFLLLGAGVAVGDRLDRRPAFTWGASALAGAAFLLNLAFATDLPAELLPLVALQLSTMAAAALVGVVTYRTCRLAFDGRTGTFAGVAVVLVGPVGFWAVVPKRHALTTLLAAVALYGLVRSRAEPARETRFRAVAYAAVALTAWVHAAEALVMLVALAPADLLTARRTDARTLAALAGAFLLALTPFLLTNLAVAGNPLRPPRTLAVYGGGVDPNAGLLGAESAGGTGGGGGGSAGSGGSAAGGGSGSGGSGSGGSGGPAGAPGFLAALPLEPLAAVAALGAKAFDRLFGMFAAGLGSLGPERLYHVFVRSGRIPGLRYAQTGGEAIDLTLLESMPLAAGAAAVPVAAARRAGRAGPALRTLPARVREPAAAPGLFAGAFVVLLTLANLSRLPLHSTVTVRYLAPVAPFLVFGLCGVPALRRTLAREGRLVAGATAALSPVAVVLAAVGGALAGLSAGGGMQAHAVANLALAGPLAGWLVVPRERDDRVGALLLAAVLAAMAAFLLLSGVEYLGQGRAFALPVARLAERLLPVL